MKNLPLLLLAFALLLQPVHAADDARSSNTIVLDATGVRNLGLETAVAEETTFEETVFALGRVEAVPAKSAVVSSRIPGRIIDLKANVGDLVRAGEEVALVESRQPGSPPPVVALAAPLGGVVTESAARLGEPVEPDKSLLTITDLSEVLAIARVPEHLAGAIQPGALARITVSAAPGGKFSGKLLRLAPAADAESGTLDAIFLLPNPARALRPGLRAEFSIITSQREGVMSVPLAAVQGDEANRFVYVTDFDLKNAYIKTPVVTGQRNDKFIEIVSGLFPADEVVTSGAYSLSFAGKGSMSLKEALDAAHGHEHAADGSELTAAQKAAKEPAGHDHASGGGGGGFNATAIFFACTTALLLALLASQSFAKRRNA